MKSVLLEWLQCPVCEHSLSLRVAEQVDEEVVTGVLSCAGCQGTYPIVDSVPRFVSQDGYAAAFGFEWNVHRTTQVDSVNGWTDSKDWLRSSLAIPLESLRGKLVLDTFDCYSPTYQSYYTYPEVFRWFEGVELERIHIGEPAVTVRVARPAVQPVESVLNAA